MSLLYLRVHPTGRSTLGHRLLTSWLLSTPRTPSLPTCCLLSFCYLNPRCSFSIQAYLLQDEKYYPRSPKVKKFGTRLRPPALRPHSLSSSSYHIAIMLRSMTPLRRIPLASRSLTTSVSPTLLAKSRRTVELAESKRSDEVGDIMAKRWLGGAGAKGTDSDRVRRRSCGLIKQR